MASSLHTEAKGSGERLVMVHGFTQTSKCWGPVADDLARDHEIVLVDAPGHGESATIAVDFVAGARLIGQAAGDGTYLGYSMGGRYCLRLALDNPSIVERLVLVSASPGLETLADRARRQNDDEMLADRLEDIGLETFIDEWLANPLFAGLSPMNTFKRERLANSVDGLASSLRLAGTGAQDPLWNRLDELSMPVLLVTGAEDAKFTDIAERMASGIGSNATHLVIPAAGHTAHLEQPEAFLATLRRWLRNEK